MQPITPGKIAEFLKRFGNLRGRLHSIRLRSSGGKASADVVVSAKEGEQKVRLRLRLDEVEEYRLQRRPGGGLTRIRRAAIGVFDGIVYLNLEDFADDERPMRIDFRMSDTFLAGRSLSFEILPGTTATEPPP